MKVKKVPMRTCLGCRETKPKKELVRIVRTPQGTIVMDAAGKTPGRGAYICRNAECLKKSIRSKALSRAFEMEIDESVLADLEKEIHGENP